VFNTETKIWNNLETILRQQAGGANEKEDREEEEKKKEEQEEPENIHLDSSPIPLQVRERE